MSTRREFLSAVAAAPLGAAPAAAGYRHRGYLGWITDLASDADSNAAWPSMRLDGRLLDDYLESFRLLRTLGFNELSIWGLYVAREWPLDLASAVSSERGRNVERLIDAAHRHGLRVLSGLGVYSWGFEAIIRANPTLSRGNPQAMCASEPAAWEWMRKVVDFVFRRFPIDGISMQSADQGRCTCTECKRYPDAEYHALVNSRVTAYVRERWPKTIIGVNSWGLRFEEPATLPSLVKMSRGIDYLIDSHDSSRKRDVGYRRRIVQALGCDLGTLGGPQVEPPQHWPRERWFLPTIKRTAVHLADLWDDGGRACEYFFHILRNPGDEATLRAAGKALSDPQRPLDRLIAEAMDETFEPRRTAARDALAVLFLRAEDAYCRYLPEGFCGTISMEPIIGSSPGPPVYLEKRLGAEQRRAYAAELALLAPEFRRLSADVRRRDKVDRVARSIDNARADALAASRP